MILGSLKNELGQELIRTFAPDFPSPNPNHLQPRPLAYFLD